VLGLELGECEALVLGLDDALALGECDTLALGVSEGEEDGLWLAD
jgi:hypothetical protein